jgi:hypothetical protein
MGPPAKRPWVTLIDKSRNYGEGRSPPQQATSPILARLTIQEPWLLYVLLMALVLG